MKLLPKLLIIVGTIIVVPVACVYGFFFQKEDPGFVKDGNFDSATYLKGRVVHGLDNTARDKNVKIQVSENDLNQLLYTVCEKKFSKYLGKELRGMTVDIQDDKYVFNLDITPIAIFSTRVSIGATLEESGEAFTFNIKTIKVGRASHVGDLALSVASNFVNDDTVNETFTNAGLSIKCSLKEKKLTYAKADMVKDVTVLLSRTGVDSSIYSALLSDILSSGLLSLDFYDDQNISLSYDLEPLHDNDTYLEDDKLDAPSYLDIAKYRSNLKTLLDNGRMDNEDSHDTIVFNYLVNGYDSLESSEQTYVDSIDMSDIGITDKRTYLDYYHPVMGTTLGQHLEADKTNLLSVGAPIKEDYINGYLRTMGIMGHSFALTYKGKADTGYTVNTVIMDQVYVNILQDKFYMTVSLNINGYETSLTLDTKTKSQTDYGIVMSTENVAYGTHDVNDDLRKEIYTILQDSLEESDWMSFDAANGELSMNFEAVARPLLPLDNMRLDVSMLGEDLASDGAISLKVRVD